MFLQMLKQEKRTVQLFTLLIFIVLSAIYLTITVFAAYNRHEMQRTEIAISEQSLVEVERSGIINKVSGRLSDLLFITDTVQNHTFTGENNTHIVELWSAFSSRKMLYDQIRFINLLGKERIRVNYQNGEVYASPENELQNKADRYYYINSIGLQKEQVFVSKLDLNVENGEIEEPINPMLRLSTPVYTQDGHLRGIVVLNYSAQDLLDQVSSIASASSGEMFLLDMDGYWLYNSQNESRAWGFMYQDRLDDSFAAAFPEEWEWMTSTDSGTLHTANGEFNFASLQLDAAIRDNGATASVFFDAGLFYIVSYIPSDTSIGQLFSESLLHMIGQVIAANWTVYLLISGVAFMFASFIGVNRAQRKEIKYYSEFDSLTGVYNRRAGYNRLTAMQKDASNKDCKITVCFLDINGLKEVNDTLGHDAGDELIQTAVSVIKENVRGNDYIARLGGDEFLIVFDQLDEDGAERVWQRIVQRFTEINEAENRKYVLSVSHGIGAFQCNADVPVDDAINRADEKMYEEKRELKRNFKAVR